MPETRVVERFFMGHICFKSGPMGHIFWPIEKNFHKKSQNGTHFLANGTHLKIKVSHKNDHF
jgi:hypothetical protein